MRLYKPTDIPCPGKLFCKAWTGTQEDKPKWEKSECSGKLLYIKTTTYDFELYAENGSTVWIEMDQQNFMCPKCKRHYIRQNNLHRAGAPIFNDIYDIDQDKFNE